MAVYRLLPGLLVLCLGAILARAIELTAGFNHLLVAIALGFVLANGLGIPSRLEPGLATHKLWLGAGIVLMGASLTLNTILEAGAVVLFVVVLVTGLTIALVELLSRNVFGLADRLGSLLAAGAGICGVSAVVAVAGAIRAREGQIAYAAATVLLFDAATIVVYPIVGDLLGLSDVVFGIWAGVSMFSTGPVVAVGFARSELAGQWATMTKLARNALIGVVVLGYASYYARTGEGARPSVRTLWDEFPKFVLGFLALVVLASAGVFSPAQRASIENAYSWLFVLAFVGLGTEIRLAGLRNTGLLPVIVVLLSLLVGSTLSLLLLALLF
ncbi:putative sulfate exporter family transporter [Natronorubrum sp. JWXQ-INN-674]|uniref:Putative sulfate exporter family transporter n=1 Tax=Natronorubrum halalkaliphilum TaxID=2691917 RepID=A0A6B0VJI4_9EURY|nr:putative sulfate exporter family transporter [Natronorubrum halalkaliphilum]MXV61700.1 putative sulfate exporter family transporter [Natronorubrum halalkaliphilum]